MTKIVGLWTMVIPLSFVFESVFSQNSESTGQVAPELVGKWCFVNAANGGAGTQTGTCITLNGDGTYEFILDNAGLAKASSFLPGTTIPERDDGTWSSQGNTIYYKSATNGEGSFHFQKMNQPQNEGTPMIVINSQAFASASAHDPW